MASEPFETSRSDQNTTRLWTNARLATLGLVRPGLGIVEKGAVLARHGRIVFAGPADELPHAERDGADTIDCEGRWITPGLIDCHTHIVHAGNRAREFEMRLQGASYEEVARAGGGIVSSVAALRAASEDDLVRETLPRLDALIAEGVTTIEAKSGYGLDLDNERKSLRAARRLGVARPVSVATTFLGAHALPPEMAATRSLHRPCRERNVAQARCRGAGRRRRRVLRRHRVLAGTDRARFRGGPRARTAGKTARRPAFKSRWGGIGRALRRAIGGSPGIHRRSRGPGDGRAGTVAVILPGAFYFIRETQKPPIELFRQHGVPMAIATDCNPGTSPLTSLLLTMNMAATLFRMTVEECIAGVTREAARALGMQDHAGTLEAGKTADLAIWDIESPAELVYRMGYNPIHAASGGADDSDYPEAGRCFARGLAQCARRRGAGARSVLRRGRVRECGGR